MEVSQFKKVKDRQLRQRQAPSDKFDNKFHRNSVGNFYVKKCECISKFVPKA